MTRQTLIMAIATLLTITNAIPMTYKINKRRENSECLYERVEEKEYLTLAVTILTGGTLSGTARIGGPFSPINNADTASLYGEGQKFYDDGMYGRLKGKSLWAEYAVSYEDIYDKDDDYEDDDEVLHDDDIDFDDDDMDDASFEDYYYDFDDDDSEYQFEEDDQMTEEEIVEVRAKKAAHDKMDPIQKEAHKNKRKLENEAKAKVMYAKRKEHKAKREEKKQTLLSNRDKERREMTGKEKEHQKMKSGEAFEITHLIKAGGWYMLCLEATYGLITAELELRKSSDVGQPNHKTGHLQTYERHEMVLKERKLLDQGRDEGEKRRAAEAAAAKAVGDSNLPVPGAIEAEDLAHSLSQMTRLNRLLNSIKEKQTAERNRLSIHATLNEHSHSRMVLSSLFETVFYICVSGFQVYTIRKWFKGNAILGY